MTPDRFARLSSLRAEIAAGTFETPERIEGTLDALLTELTEDEDRKPLEEDTTNEHIE